MTGENARPRALIVDDSRVARAMIARALGGIYEMEQADCAEAALVALASEKAFDVMLVDWNMPGQTGVELVEQIREAGHFPNLKILMITTEVETESVSTALDKGVDEYLMKPFVREAVLEKLSLLGLPCSEQ